MFSARLRFQVPTLEISTHADLVSMISMTSETTIMIQKAHRTLRNPRAQIVLRFDTPEDTHGWWVTLVQSRDLTRSQKPTRESIMKDPDLRGSFPETNIKVHQQD